MDDRADLGDLRAHLEHPNPPDGDPVRNATSASGDQGSPGDRGVDIGGDIPDDLGGRTGAREDLDENLREPCREGEDRWASAELGRGGEAALVVQGQLERVCPRNRGGSADTAGTV